MGRRVEVKNLLMVGAGPIRRGQACEFNYAGVQGIAALKEEGIRMMAVIYDREDFASALRRAPQLSPVHEVLVERSVEKRSLSWK
ncbi:MAG: carbamoyl phosphate synthase preATP-grasp domain-containing protein [Thermoanaerobaculaceae bacterium]